MLALPLRFWLSYFRLDGMRGDNQDPEALVSHQGLCADGGVDWMARLGAHRGPDWTPRKVYRGGGAVVPEPATKCLIEPKYGTRICLCVPVSDRL
jgi:hypothetical protein